MKNTGSFSRSSSVISLFVISLWAASCVASTKPSIKIGLVGPFEGRYREVGEEVIYAARLAVREVNQAGGLAGYTVELVAFDDGGEPDQAAEQARKLAADPQMLGVMGNWLDSTTGAAAPIYAESGIALIAMGTTGELSPTSFRLWYSASGYLDANPGSDHCPLPCDNLEDLTWLDSARQAQPLPSTPSTEGASGQALSGPAAWGLNQFPRLVGKPAEGVAVIAPAPLPQDSAGPEFADRYAAVSGAGGTGSSPRYLAVLAYDAARILFAAIERDISVNRLPTRSGALAALAQTDYDGLSGHASFDSNHEWAEAKGWVYVWREGRLR